MQLWPFQQEIIINTRAALTKHKRVLIVSPTGSGKTKLASHMVGEAAKRNRTSWFVVHREELVTQTVDTFRTAGIQTGVIAAGYPATQAPVQVCMVQSLPRRLTTPPDMIIWDEAHRRAALTYQKIADHCADSYHIGLTATPARTDGKPLGAYFDCMVQGPSVAWLIENGYLSQYRYFAPDLPDLSGVGIRAGDYAAGDVEAIMAGKAIVGNMVKHWQAQAGGMVTVGFAPTVALSQEYAQAFQEAGIASVHLDGTTDRAERRDALEAFAGREHAILWNCDLVSEGFDLAALSGIDITIECVIMGSPTQSLVRNRQRLGRSLRRKPKPAIILDHVGDFTRHGFPNAAIEWSLEHKPKLIRPGGRITPMSRCGACFAMMPPVRVCPVCGVAREVAEREMLHLEGDLKELKEAAKISAKDAQQARRKKERMEEGMARSLEELQEIGRQRGYDHRWAVMRYASRRK